MEYGAEQVLGFVDVLPSLNYEEMIIYETLSQMIRDIGEGVDMNYSASGSGALDMDARDYLRHNLGYDVYMHWSYNINVILRELIAGLPVYIGALEPMEWWGPIPLGPRGGHAWVIDGFKWIYNYINGMRFSSLMVHCNWGWRSDSNGYYLSGIFDSSHPDNEYDIDNDSNNMNFNLTWYFTTMSIKP